MLARSLQARPGSLPSRGERTSLALVGYGLAAFFCAIILSGCVTEAPPTTFDLDPSIPVTQNRASRSALVIDEPTTAPALDSRRILVRTGTDSIAYLHGGQWAANLPSLVQDRLIDGFTAAHVMRAVGRPGMVADRSLQTDIQRFEVDVGRKQAIIAIYVRLIAGNGQVVAAKLFSATAPAANDHAPIMAAALSQAFAKVVHEIVIWTAPRG
jgi:cholesterol transport system auxiliary component